MRWKTTNLHLQKGNKLAVYRDSALFSGKQFLKLRM